MIMNIFSYLSAINYIKNMLLLFISIKIISERILVKFIYWRQFLPPLEKIFSTSSGKLFFNYFFTSLKINIYTFLLFNAIIYFKFINILKFPNFLNQSQNMYIHLNAIFFLPPTPIYRYCQIFLQFAKTHEISKKLQKYL